MRAPFLLCFLAALPACKDAEAGPPTTALAVDASGAPISVTSTAFSAGQTIPKTFTCSGADVSPPLVWSGVAGTARSLLVIVDDPDAPGGTFTHWMLFDVPVGTTSLAQGATAGVAGKNGFGKLGYGGPCPPPGSPHHYYFRVYALDSASLGLSSGASRGQVDTAAQGHVVGYGALMATFGR